MQIVLTDGTKEARLPFTGRVRLMDALRGSGLELNFPCAGRGVCGKCRVNAVGALSPRTETERRLLAGEAEEVRLACQAYAEGGCTVRLLNREARILEKGDLPPFTLSPLGRAHGFAVDIGTTTVALRLYRLSDGRPLAARAFPNPQARYGADVIARIQAALDGRGPELRRLIRDELQRAMESACTEAGVRREEVDALVVTGNTTMLYLFCGISPEPFSRAPFTLTETFGASGGAADRLEGFPNAPVLYPRTISPFVGSDITCSLLASRIAQGAKAGLLCDIGTNGEIVLAKEGKLWCCSTAAGPAFEGVGIELGSPAVDGAIDRVTREASGTIRYSVVGGGEAAGICGSGLIDAVSALLRAGLVDETGRIDDECETFRGQPALRIGNSGVFLTQKDLRSVQLAKAAICAGIRSLLHEAGAQAEETLLILAGGFGSYLDPARAADIGLIPRGLLPRTRAVGNAALAGASLILLGEGELERSEALARRAQVLELPTSPFFTECYVEEMMFPGVEEE